MLIGSVSFGQLSYGGTGAQQCGYLGADNAYKYIGLSGVLTSQPGGTVSHI